MLKNFKLIIFILLSMLICSSIFAISCNFPFKAIIFDCDGVLVDTELLKFKAWERALKLYGISLSVEEYMPLIGYSADTILKKINFHKGINISSDAINWRNKFYKEMQAESVAPIESAITLARELAQEKNNLHIKLALASSAPKTEIMHNLNAIGLMDIFDCIISGKDDLIDVIDPAGTNKPKPYIYQRLAQWLEVAPEECLVFEDTNAGVIAARDAGMTAYAVPNKLTKQQDFSRATKILQNLADFSIENTTNSDICQQ